MHTNKDCCCYLLHVDALLVLKVSLVCIQAKAPLFHADALLLKKYQSINGVNLELSSVGSEEGSLDTQEAEVAPPVEKRTLFDNKLERTEVETTALYDETTLSLTPRFEKPRPASKVQGSQKFKRKEVQKASQTSLKAFFSRSLCRSKVSAKPNIADGGFLSASQESQMQESVDDIKAAVSYSNSVMLDRSCQFDSDKILATSVEHEDHTIVYNCVNKKLCRNDSSEELEKADVKQENAQAQWKRIQDLMTRCIPVCRHGEPCVARIVKKSGPNHGRGFYVCARAEVSFSNPSALSLVVSIPVCLCKEKMKC